MVKKKLFFLNGSFPNLIFSTTRSYLAWTVLPICSNICNIKGSVFCIQLTFFPESITDFNIFFSSFFSSEIKNVLDIGVFVHKFSHFVLLRTLPCFEQTGPCFLGKGSRQKRGPLRGGWGVKGWAIKEKIIFFGTFFPMFQLSNGH